MRESGHVLPEQCPIPPAPLPPKGPIAAGWGSKQEVRKVVLSSQSAYFCSVSINSICTLEFGGGKEKCYFSNRLINYFNINVSGIGCSQTFLCAEKAALTAQFMSHSPEEARPLLCGRWLKALTVLSMSSQEESAQKASAEEGAESQQSRAVRVKLVPGSLLARG